MANLPVANYQVANLQLESAAVLKGIANALDYSGENWDIDHLGELLPHIQDVLVTLGRNRGPSTFIPSLVAQLPFGSMDRNALETRMRLLRQYTRHQRSDWYRDRRNVVARFVPLLEEIPLRHLITCANNLRERLQQGNQAPSLHRLNEVLANFDEDVRIITGLLDIPHQLGYFRVLLLEILGRRIVEHAATAQINGNNNDPPIDNNGESDNNSGASASGSEEERNPPPPSPFGGLELRDEDDEEGNVSNGPRNNGLLPIQERGSDNISPKSSRRDDDSASAYLPSSGSLSRKNMRSGTANNNDKVDSESDNNSGASGSKEGGDPPPTSPFGGLELRDEDDAAEESFIQERGSDDISSKSSRDDDSTSNYLPSQASLSRMQMRFEYSSPSPASSLTKKPTRGFGGNQSRMLSTTDVRAKKRQSELQQKVNNKENEVSIPAVLFHLFHSNTFFPFATHQH